MLNKPTFKFKYVSFKKNERHCVIKNNFKSLRALFNTTFFVLFMWTTLQTNENNTGHLVDIKLTHKNNYVLVQDIK